jgi:hypothetical protein
MGAPNLPDLLTPSDVARWLSLPTSRVVNLARQGKIPCIVLPGGEMVFDPDELAQWLNALRTERKGEPCPA